MKTKKLKLLFGVLCVASIALSSSVAAQQQGQLNEKTEASQQTTSSVDNQMATTVRGVLIFSDSIIGAPVKNDQGEEIGDIQRLLINPQTGLVSYIEVSVGGFLGMGEKNVVVPWRALTASREGDSLVLNVSKQVLRETPESQTSQSPQPMTSQEQQQQNQQEQQKN